MMAHINPNRSHILELLLRGKQPIYSGQSKFDWGIFSHDEREHAWLLSADNEENNSSVELLPWLLHSPPIGIDEYAEVLITSTRQSGYYQPVQN
jgi:hypothetical protein